MWVNSFPVALRPIFARGSRSGHKEELEGCYWERWKNLKVVIGNDGLLLLLFMLILEALRNIIEQIEFIISPIFFNVIHSTIECELILGLIRAMLKFRNLRA